MSEEENKNLTPSRMRRVAFPKAKFGVYIAIFIVLLILLMFFMMEIDKYLLLLSVPLIISLVYQMKTFEINNPKSCLNAFKNNNLIGLLVFIFIFSFNIL